MSNPEGTLKPGRKKTGGRQKGVTNKVNKELKDMILGALNDVGGQKYLARQAEENPGPFLTLIGKILPKDVNVSDVNDTPEPKQIVFTVVDARTKHPAE